MSSLTNANQYSTLWRDESDFLKSHDIYDKLSEFTPVGNILEIGCGVGNGTMSLLKKHSVLSLDSNPYLIKEAQSRLESSGLHCNIRKCDFFDLSEEDKSTIRDFKPQVLVAWFIGSHGEDIYKHTEEQPDPGIKSKLYREKIEDIIVSDAMLVDTVKYIHLVARGAVREGVSKDVIFAESKRDYDTYVFNKVGFEVIDVQQIPWPVEDSKFQYIAAPNPEFTAEKIIPMITSLIAKKI